MRPCGYPFFIRQKWFNGLTCFKDTTVSSSQKWKHGLFSFHLWADDRHCHERMFSDELLFYNQIWALPAANLRSAGNYYELLFLQSCSIAISLKSLKGINAITWTALCSVEFQIYPDHFYLRSFLYPAKCNIGKNTITLWLSIRSSVVWLFCPRLVV